MNQKTRHKDIYLGFFPNSEGLGVEVSKRGKIHYSRSFWGRFFIFLEEGKGLQIKNMKKYLLNILPPQQVRKICVTKFFPVLLHLRDTNFH
jgi:hypothetical protein